MDDEHCGLYVNTSRENYARFIIITPTGAIVLSYSGKIVPGFSMSAVRMLIGERRYSKVELP